MEWNLAINRNRFIRAGNSEAVGRIRVELARRTRAILPSHPLPSVLLSLPFARKSSCCVSECVRARLRARACVSEIPKTLPTLCFILLLLFFFSFFCPCRRYSAVRSPRSLPAPRFFHSRTLSPEAKEARVPLRLTFSGMNYFARRVAFVKIRLLDSSNQSPAVYVAPSDATGRAPPPPPPPRPLVKSPKFPPLPSLFLSPPISRSCRHWTLGKEEGRKVAFAFFRVYTFFETCVDSPQKRQRDDGIRRSINPSVAYDSRLTMRAQLWATGRGHVTEDP